MPVVRSSSYSRLIEFINNSGEPVREVRLNCSFWGFGSASWPLAEHLEHGAASTWAFEDRKHRVAAFFVSYKRPGSDAVIHSPLLQGPWNSYFRWMSCELGASTFHGMGRVQGVPGPTYGTGLFSGMALEFGDDILSASMQPRKAPAEAGPAGTRFFELLNFSKHELDIQSLTLARADDELTEVVVDKRIQPGNYIEVDFGDEALQVIGFKLNHRVDGAPASIKADFSLANKQWLRYGSVVFRGNEGDGNLEWQGATLRADGRVHQRSFTPPARPSIFVEPDPNPEFPDAFCAVPMRVRNGERYPVAVRLATTYKSEGDSHYCGNEVMPGFEDVEVQALGFRPLGCSRYRTPNMLCAEVKTWKPLWALAFEHGNAE